MGCRGAGVLGERRLDVEGWGCGPGGVWLRGGEWFWLVAGEEWESGRAGGGK